MLKVHVTTKAHLCILKSFFSGKYVDFKRTGIYYKREILDGFFKSMSKDKQNMRLCSCQFSLNFFFSWTEESKKKASFPFCHYLSLFLN